MKRKLLSLALTLAMVTALALPAVASGQTTVHASTTEELLSALKSNTTITLEAKEYPIDWLEILEMENVTIQGVPGTRLTPLEKGYPFILVTESSNITIKNISIGHDTYETLVDIYGEGFDGGLVAISDAKNVLVDGCELYGNGSVGIDVFMGSGIQVRNTTVRECSGPIAGLADGDMTFTNCTFTGNSFGSFGGEPCFSALSLDAYSVNSSMTFKDCTFTGNKGEYFTYPTDNTQSFNIPFLDTVGSTSRWQFGAFVVSTTLENCTFSGNSWTAPAGAGTAPAPAGRLAYTSTQEIEVDGQKVTFEAYALKDANGNDTNYIKLRDVAYVLNGTAAQFEVGWNGSVTITTGQAYTPNGSEMSTPYSGNRAYKDASAATVVNGSPVQLSAILLTDDSGNGYTYYKLRDLGQALGFKVDWTAQRGIFIETN